MKCPTCKSNITGGVPIDGKDRGPTVGDVAMCWSCSSFIQFSNDGFESLSDDDFSNLPKNMQDDLNFAKQLAEEHNKRFGE